MRILIVEDESLLANRLATTLGERGYAVDIATDGERGDFPVSTEQYDAVILDLGLPRIDGLTLLERWRAGGIAVPVLVLTARGSWSEKVRGIDGGADDYQVTLDGQPVKLTSHELRVLSYLMHHRGRVVSQTELTEHIYAQTFDRDSNTVEVFIARLRRKLGASTIETVRGLGYRIGTES